MVEKVTFDNDTIHRIDREMRWIEKDGSCPSKTADEQGVDCKIINGVGMAWRSRDNGVWSYCILHYKGLTTTLLAKSFKELCRLHKQLIQRVDASWTKEPVEFGDASNDIKYFRFEGGHATPGHVRRELELVDPKDYCSKKRGDRGCRWAMARDLPGHLHMVNSCPGLRHWQKYYSNIWERRYAKWCCKSPQFCSCQLCRMAGKN